MATPVSKLENDLVTRSMLGLAPSSVGTSSAGSQKKALIYGPPSKIPRTFQSFQTVFYKFTRDIVLHFGGDESVLSDLARMEKMLSDLREIKEAKRGGSGGGGGRSGGRGHGSGGGGGTNDESFAALLKRILVEFCKAAEAIASKLSDVIGTAWKQFWQGSGKEFTRWTLAIIFGYFGLPSPDAAL